MIFKKNKLEAETHTMKEKVKWESVKEEPGELDTNRITDLSVNKNKLEAETQAMKEKVKQESVKEEPGELDTNRITNLSVNTLMQGMLVLGCVKKVQLHRLSLSLPGGVCGQLPVMSISPSYELGLFRLKKKKRIEFKVPPSFKTFQLGEMLCCRINVIREIGDLYPEVLVSTNPKDVNSGRSRSNIKAGDLLIASVAYRDVDKYVMYTGIQELTAFLTISEAVKYIEERDCNSRLVSGQIVRCIVSKTTECSSSTVVELVANPDTVSRAVLTSDIAIEDLIPTAKVKAIIRNVQQDGLEVRVSGCPADIIGYIELSHLESCWSKPEDYIPGTELTATILCVIRPMKVVFLSLKKDISGIVEQKLKRGAIIENAKIEAVTKEGIEVIIGKKEDELKGLIHLRHIDGNVDFENLPLKYPIGTEIKTRVISFDHIRQIYICSLERSFIDKKYVSVSDVTVGDVVDCTVEKMNDYRARLRLEQFSIFAPFVGVKRIKRTRAKLLAGKRVPVKARVLCIDEITETIYGTLNQRLLDCEPLLSWEQASEGDQYYGQIVHISKESLDVHFFNDVVGILPRENIDYAADLYVGQVIKCNIVSVDFEEEKNKNKHKKKWKLILGFTRFHPDQNICDRIENEELMSHISRQLGGDVSSTNHGLDKKLMKLKARVCKFTSYLKGHHRRQDYKTGARLTGIITTVKCDGIVVVFKGGIQGLLSASRHDEYIPGEDIEVLVLWQNQSDRLLHLQPVGTFLEDQNVMSSKYIIGSYVDGRVLFSEPRMAICLLLEEKILAYVVSFGNTILPVGSDRRLIVLNVVDHYVICSEWLNTIKFCKNKQSQVHEHIAHEPELNVNEQCCEEMEVIPEEESKQNSEDNYGSELDKCYKRKSEHSFIEGEVHKKMKNNSFVSNKEEINNISIKSEQEKNQKQEEMVMNGFMNGGDASSKNIELGKNLKNQVDDFVSYLRACHRKQVYKTGTRLTGKIAAVKRDGIHVVFEGGVQGILPGSDHRKYIPGKDIEVMVVWQNQSNKLLYLQPVGVFQEAQSVISRKGEFITGSFVTGRVLYSESQMAICALLEAHTLAYVLCIDRNTLRLGINRKLIVQSVVHPYLICFDMEDTDRFCRTHQLDASEDIGCAPQLKFKGQIPEEESQQNSEDNSDSESST